MKYVTKYHILLNRLIGLFASWVLAALLVSAASAAPVLTGAGFVSGNYVYVGEFGTGTLQFNPGDTLTTTSTGSGNGYAVIGYAGPGISDPTDIGIVNINGAGASWSVQNGLFDGEYGSGTITISNGGTLTTATASGSSYQNVLGYASGSSGVMNVTGVGSTWNSGGSIFIGGNGSQSASTASGALNITQGGVVNTTVIGSYPYFQGVEVGAGVGTTATVLVDGAGSQWNLFGGGFAASEFGSAVTITVSNGGQINSPGINLGGATTGNTTMTITGADPVTGAVSTVNASITVASNLSTTTTNPAPVLNITNGGVLNSASATVGSFGSTGQGITKGIVNIDGTGSQWNITGSSLLIGSDGGVGTVTLTNGATVSDYTSTTSPATGIGDGIITLGGAPSSSNGGTPVSTATLNIGTGGVAGIVNAAGITGYAASTNPPLVSANSTIIFNHNSTGYYFTNTGTASGTGIVVSGSTKLQTVAGTTIITALDTNVGATTLNGGILSISTLGNGGVVLPTSGTTGASTVTVSNAAGLVVGEAAIGGVIGTGATITGISGNTLTLSVPNLQTSVGAGSTTYGNGNGLGISTNAASNLVFNGGTLLYTGVAASTDRLFTLGANGGTIDSSGSGAITFTNTGTTAFTGSGARTLTLTGSNTGVNTLSNGMGDGSGGATSLIVNDSGTWILAGTGTFTGGTTISAGTLQIGNGGATGSIVGNVADGTTLIVDRAGAVALPGMISGVGNLIQEGTGVLTLSGANTYQGGTSDIGGLINFANLGNFGTGQVTLNGGGLQWATGNTIDVSSSSQFNPIGANGTTFDTNGNNVTFATAISTTGSITKAGAGVLTFSVDNSYQGGTTVTGGLINFSDLGDFGSGNITLNGGGLQWATGNTLDVSSSGRLNPLGSGGGTFDTNGNAVTLAGAISGSGGVTKAGSGTLALNGLNTYGGVTTVNAGTLSVNKLANGGSASSIGQSSSAASNLVLNNATFQYTGTGDATDRGVTFGAGGGMLDASGSGALTFSSTGTGILAYTPTGTAEALTFTGTGTGILNPVIANNGSGVTTVTKNGTGTWVFAAANTYSGSTTINGGTLMITNATGSGTGTGSVTIGALGTFQIGNGGTVGSTTSTISGSGSVIFDQSGTVTYGSALGSSLSLTQAGTGTLILTGANTYSNGTTISAGTLQINNGSSLGSITGNVLDDSALVFAPFLNTNTFSGVITGTGSVTLSGSGIQTLTLAATDAYTGATIINGGTLIATKIDIGGNVSSIGASSNAAANLVINGGTLDYTGSGVTTDRGMTLSSSGGTINSSGTGALNFSNTGALAYSTSNTAELLTLTGSVGGTYNAAIGNNGTGATSVTVNSGGATWLLTGNNSYSGTTTISAGTVQIGSSSLTGNIANNGTLIIDNSSNITLSGQISGFSFSKEGAGTLTLGNNNTYTLATTILGGLVNFSGPASFGTGGISINGGGLQWATGTTTDISSRTTIGASGATFDTNGNNVTFATALSTPGGMTKAGAGTLTFVTTDTYSSGITISGGTLQLGNGGATGTVTGAVLDNSVLAFDRAAFTFSNTITGTGSVLQEGPGILTLSGSNGYEGGTTVTSSLIDFASLGNFGTGLITLNGGGLQWATGNTIDISSDLTAIGANGATFDTQSNNVTFATGLTGTGGVTKAGSGTLTFTAANLYNGGTTLSAGTLSLGNAGALNNTGNISFTGGTLLYSAANSVDYSSLIVNSSSAIQLNTNGDNVTYASALSASNSGGLSKAGAGTLTLTANNLYTGTTTVSAGTLQIGNGGTSGSINTAGNVTDTAALVFDLSSNLAITGTISGTGGTLTQEGTGTLILTGNNTYTGGITISAGTLQIGNGSTTGSISNTGTLADGTALVFDRSSALTYSGTISGNGLVMQEGTGVLTLSGTNTYKGTTTLAGGELNVGSAGAINSTSALIFTGGSLQYSTANTVDYSSRIVNSSSAISIDTNSKNVTFASILSSSNSGGLTKLGAGTLTLTAAEAYSGSTTLALGTLTLGSAGAIGTGSLIFDGGVFNGGSTARALANTVLIEANSGIVGSANLSLGPLTNSGISELNILNTGTTTFGNINLSTGSATGQLFEFAGSGNIVVTGIIADGGSLPGELAVYANSGTITLQGADTYTGITDLVEGSVTIGNNLAFGTSTVILNGVQGASLLKDDGNVRTLANAIQLTNGTSDIGGTAGLILNGTISTSSTSSGATGLTVDGTGTDTITLNGANTYTGTTTASTGTLVLTNGTAINGGVTTSSIGTSTLALSGGTVQGTGSSLLSFTDAVSLAASSTFGGSTSLSFGALTESNSFTLTNNDSGTVTFSAISLSSSNTGRTLTISGTGNTTVTGVVGNGGNGAGGVTKSGMGTLTFSGANTYTGVTTISQGILSVSTLANGGTNSGIGKATNVAANLVLNGGTLQYTGGTASTDHLFTLGTGTSGGTINASGTGAVTFSNAGATAFTGSGTRTLTFTGSSTAQNTFNSVLGDGTGGATSLTKTGTGEWVLGGANTYSGTTTISAGTLAVASFAANGTAQPLGKGTGAILLGNAMTATDSSTLDYTGSSTVTLARGLTVATGDSATILNTGGKVLTLSGTISKNGSVLNLSGGQFNVSGPITGALANSDLDVINNSTVALTNNSNSYDGPTNVYGNSTLITGVNNAIPSDSVVTLGSAGDSTSSQTTNTLDLQGTSQTVAGLYNVNVTGTHNSINQVISSNGTATPPVVGSGASGATGSLAISYSGTSTDTFSGSLGGAGSATNFSVTKSGSGALDLAGTNTYTGGTTVSGGNLIVDGSVPGNILVQSAAELNGHGSIGGTIRGAGVVAPGDSPSILTAAAVDPTGGLDFDLQFNQAGVATWSNAAASGNDVLHLTSTTAPFIAPLASTNVINLYFSALHTDYLGGFFTNGSTDVLTADLASATFHYYLLDNTNGTVSYEGNLYDVFTGPVSITPMQILGANFGDGTVDGWTEQIVAAPEPGTWGLFLMGGLALWFYRQRSNAIPS